MSEMIVAKRYAEALFQLGSEKELLDQYVDEFREIRKVFLDNDQLYTFLNHPKVNNEEKKQFITTVFKGVHVDVKNTLLLLIEKKRMAIAPSMVDHFIAMVNEARGIAAATVYSVRPLSKKEQKSLQATLAERFNKKAIELQNEIDPSIIGGLKIHVGNTIFDGSVQGKLQRMERNIATANK